MCPKVLKESISIRFDPVLGVRQDKVFDVESVRPTRTDHTDDTQTGRTVPEVTRTTEGPEHTGRVRDRVFPGGRGSPGPSSGDEGRVMGETENRRDRKRRTSGHGSRVRTTGDRTPCRVPTSAGTTLVGVVATDVTGNRTGTVPRNITTPPEESQTVSK